jgi:HKD family nuclease
MGVHNTALSVNSVIIYYTICTKYVKKYLKLKFKKYSSKYNNQCHERMWTFFKYFTNVKTGTGEKSSQLFTFTDYYFSMHRIYVI